MFEKAAPSVPAFFEFVSPVYFDGVGYVEKVAVDESFSSSDCPTCEKYVAACDGYLFVLQNGASTCVSSANVKFLAGKRASEVRGPGDGEEKNEGRRNQARDVEHKDQVIAQPGTQVSKGPGPGGGRGAGARTGR